MPDQSFASEFDVIVIGAGINGAGIARDAAMRGLKVLLLDKGDLGSGTSSWSTRLVHGGLRYLEHGELGLVRESLREREALLNISPQLVRPLEILVPIYKHARRGVWTIRVGMIAYDLLSFGKALPRHRMLSRTETLQRVPELSSEGLLGAAVYFDAQVEFAERLVLENALSAIEHGATVITYARVSKFLIEDDKVYGVEFTHVQSPTSNIQSRLAAGTAGVSPADGSSLTLRKDSVCDQHSATAHLIINAAGPWVDHVLNESGSNSPRLIGGTKGSHMIVAPFPGAPRTAIYVEAQTDQRPFFIIPWNRNYLIGTTDIPYDDDLDQVPVYGKEIDYLLRETNRVIPAAELTRKHILYSYAGVRPLPFTGDQPAPDITRQHFIREHPRLRNLFSIVGGKLTTYRSLAEQTVDLVFRKLQRTSPLCATDREPLPGSRVQSPTSKVQSPSDRLSRIYGTRSALVMNLLAEDSSLAEVFDPETGAIAAEVVFTFKHELAQTLSDCLLRRTMVGLNSTCGLDAVETAGKIARQHLGWSDSRATEEIATYRDEISRRFREPESERDQPKMGSRGQ
jgi:glycerol-3-phosphate dehydrogenase